MKLSRSVIAFVAVAVVAAGSGFLLLPADRGELGAVVWITMAMAFGAGLRPVRFPCAHMEFTAFFPIVFFDMVVFGPRVAVAAGLLGVAGAAVGRKGWPRPARFVFNLAAIALAAELASLAFEFLSASRAPDELTKMIVPMLGAVGVFAVVNTILVGCVIALEHRRSPVDACEKIAERTLASFTVGFSAAIAMLAVYPASIVWSLAVALGPWWLIGSYSRGRADAESDDRR